MHNIQNPPQNRLYTLSDLVAGYDPTDPSTILATYTFRQYQAFYPIRAEIAHDAARYKDASMHDVCIAIELAKFLKSKKPIGIMGGHSISRNEPAYFSVARLARKLTQSGFLVVTGGGPGLMEAGHVGAFFANSTENEFESALFALGSSEASAIPKEDPKNKVLKDDGAFNPNFRDDGYIKKLQTWFEDARLVASKVQSPGSSLAISTWKYGHEPVMPFATHYAAFCLNSLREAALVRDSLHGIIYGRGGGGTIREIFQDVEENYYVDSSKKFSPMVFFDPSGYYNPSVVGNNSIKLDDVFARIFGRAFSTRKDPIDWQSRILFTTDVGLIVDTIRAYESTLAQKE